MALFQFASLAVGTQIVLLLNQILLLPIQLRAWGTDVTAYWQTTMSVALLTGVADLGLRAAGHAEIFRSNKDPNDHESREEFVQIWAWMRILILSTTVLLVAADFLFQFFVIGHGYPIWRAALLVGCAMEVQLCMRVGYLDSLNFYREAEAGYFFFAAGRLVLAVGALAIFHASPAVLAFIWLIAGVIGLMQQSLLCRRAGRLYLFEPLPAKLSWKTFAMVRYTLADPLGNWARISAPVVVLAAIQASPIAIVTYVALRSIFGAARTTINQLSRYASVEYTTLWHDGKRKKAELHFNMMILLASFFASGVGAFVIADNGRLASLILNKMDLPIYVEIAMAFALGNAFFAYQISAAVSRRAGEVAEIAHRQYFYIACIAVFSVIALVVKSLLLWMGLLLAADVLIALTFYLWPPAHSILQLTASGWRGALAGAMSAALVLVVWLLMHYENFSFLSGRSVWDIVCTIAFFLTWILLIGLVDLLLFYGMRVKNMSLPAALVDWMQKVREAKLQNE